MLQHISPETHWFYNEFELVLIYAILNIMPPYFVQLPQNENAAQSSQYPLQSAHIMGGIMKMPSLKKETESGSYFWLIIAAVMSICTTYRIHSVHTYGTCPRVAR